MWFRALFFSLLVFVGSAKAVTLNYSWTQAGTGSFSGTTHTASETANVTASFNGSVWVISWTMSWTRSNSQISEVKGELFGSVDQTSSGTRRSAAYVPGTEYSGSWTVTPGPAFIRVWFRALTGGTNYVGPINIPLTEVEYCVKWRVKNTDGNGVLHNADTARLGRIEYYRMMQNGVQIGEEVQVGYGKEAYIGQGGLTDNNPVILEGSYHYPYRWDAAAKVWKKNEVEVLMWTEVDTQIPQVGECANPTEITTQEGGAVPVDNDDGSEVPEGPANPVGEDDTGGSVWDSDANTEPLDKGTYVEGVGKIEKWLEKISLGIDGLELNISVPATDLSGVESRLDQANTTLGEVKNSVGILTGETEYPYAETTLGQAQAEAANRADYEGQAPSGSVGAFGAGASPTTLSAWEITPGNTIQVAMIPTALWEAASAVLVVCRNLILWAAVIAFIRSCGGVLQAYIIGLPQVTQAEAAVGIENALPGVAQAKTWGAAGLIVAALVTAIGVMVGIIHTQAANFGFGGISSMFSTGGVDTGGMGEGLGLLNRYIPAVALLQLFVFRAGFTYLCAPLYVGAAGAIKFLKA